MNISHPFILRPIATSLLMVALFLTGLLGFRLLPVSSLPEVEYPSIQVSTFYPGASPDVITSGVTAPLETQFGQMQGLNQMHSASSTGASIITLQFTLDTTIDVAEQEVQAAINAAATYLPADLPNPPIYNKINPADTPILTLALTSKTLPLPQVEDFADTRLSPKIAQLSGVGEVSLSGGQRPAVRIKVNPDRLTAYGLTLENVRAAISAGNVNAAKGNFDGPHLSYTINDNDQLLSSAEYKPLIIAYRNNAPVRLSDVAEVIDDAENVNLAAWMNTTPAIIMDIQRQPGANVIAVVTSIKQLLLKLKDNLPSNMQVSILTDRTNTIKSSISNVQADLLVSVTLVVLVIFLFLRSARATIIPGIAVPLSLIGTLGVMYLLNFSLNNLTLMALTIAAGFVADDAIVMIENIARYTESGIPPLEAALKGSGQIGFTIVSLTVSLIAVLIPLLFMSDIIGLLFREFAMTLGVAIIISAFISLTLTPTLCARILQYRAEDKKNAFDRFMGVRLDRLIEHYGMSLRWVLDRQSLVLTIALITLLITATLLYFIPKGFFPVQDTGVIQAISEGPQSISFSAMAKHQQALAKIVLADPAVENLSSIIGIDGINTTLNSGRMLITLKPLSKRNVSASEVIQRLEPKISAIAGMQLYMLPVQDISIDTLVSRTLYQYSINAPNQAAVAKWSDVLLNKLKQEPVLRDLASDQQNRGLQTHVTIDRDTASRLGITAQMIDDTLYDAFGQRQVSTMFTERNQYRVVQEITPSLQKNPHAFDHMYVTSPTNGAIPFNTFTHITEGLGSLVINRQGQFPVTTLSFNLAPNAALGDAINAVNNVVKSLHIPSSVQTSFEGSAKVFENSLSNESWLVLAAVLVVYIVLGVLYESYIHPITILSTLPSAGMGALIALFLTNNSLSIIALIGLILLIGIVMKNAIMMIDFALAQEREYQKSPRDAIYQACLLRLRPILMTTMAALFGAVPLAFGSGMGSELRRPLGIVIIAGLLVSQLLTLYTTPVIYLTIDKLSRKVSRWRHNNNPSSSPSGEIE
ncbi:MAG: multidrug efflux RND transporter permease subunit [Legionellales bacterium]|nr:multidrug efflux RND transporter permease subunit [Legionellales bacterium]